MNSDDLDTLLPLSTSVQCQHILYCDLWMLRGRQNIGAMSRTRRCVILTSQNSKFDLDRENVSVKFPNLAKNTRNLNELLFKEGNKYQNVQNLFMSVTANIELLNSDGKCNI